MGKIKHISKEELKDGLNSPGILRKIAFREDRFLIVRSQVDPGVISGWHHHGNYSVYGYIASGTVKFDCGPGGNDTLVIPKGDFFHVPPKTIHRDINPSQTEPQEVIIFFFGDGPMVINVDGPDKS